MTKMKILTICAIAVTINFILSEIVVILNIPLLYLDAVGTIFIASTFDIKYGVLTGCCTNILTGLLTSPLAFPYVFVNITIAVLVHVFTKSKKLSYLKAAVLGLLIALITSVISTPITILLFGGMTNSFVDFFIQYIHTNGESFFIAAYCGTALRNIVDKIFSCILVVYIINHKRIISTIINL